MKRKNPFADGRQRFRFAEPVFFHLCTPLSEALVGTSGLEPPTSRLSGVRSNHLSYAPIKNCEAIFNGGVLLRGTSSSISLRETAKRPGLPALHHYCDLSLLSLLGLLRHSYGVRSPNPLLVEMRRIELLTPCVQGRCSPS